MNIVKDWTTLELIEFLNSYKRATKAEQVRYGSLMVAVRNELNTRHQLIGGLYA